MIDRQFITHRADGGLESFAIRLIDGLRSLNPIDRVRRASDDLIPADARELLKGAIGENIAAIIDAFRRDTDGNVVDHRFQEIPAVGEFVGELALFGAILMSGDEAAVGQVPVLDQNRAAVLEIADIPLALLGRAGIFLDGRLDEAPLLAQLQKIAAGHAGEKIETVETVHLEVAVVAKYDAFLRVEHHDAVGEVVERAGYKGRTPDIGMARAAQRRRYPENDRSKERNDPKAAFQSSMRRTSHPDWQRSALTRCCQPPSGHRYRQQRLQASPWSRALASASRSLPFRGILPRHSLVAPL